MPAEWLFNSNGLFLSTANLSWESGSLNRSVSFTVAAVSVAAILAIAFVAFQPPHGQRLRLDRFLSQAGSIEITADFALS